VFTRTTGLVFGAAQVGVGAAAGMPLCAAVETVGAVVAAGMRLHTRGAGGTAMRVDEPDQYFLRRSSSLWAKNADALRRISLAR